MQPILGRINFMINKITQLEWLKKTLGPGILFASTAIGVSHLVQSTRAGANYGFGLLFLLQIYSNTPSSNLDLVLPMLLKPVL